MLFHEYKLKQGLLKALDKMGYTESTPIQDLVITAALRGRNIVGQSQTGTGKTAAFLLPMLNRIDTNKKWLQALILAPTRELVNQIGDEIFKLTTFYRVNAVCVYGGASLEVQRNKLKRDPSIIVATPGRLMDFINQKVINLAPVEFFVLDEVDRMLDMWFVRDIRKIRAQMKNIKQTYTFSATISDDIKKIIQEHIADYESIKIAGEVTVDKIHHSYMQIEHEHKLANVKMLIDSHPKDKILIFTQTKRNTKAISEKFADEGYNIAMLNGNMSQGKRMSTLARFKEGTTRILVTTDVAARGLNMNNIGLVINFDVPNEAESYVHRIGRTGRAWAEGKAIILVSEKEIPLIQNIERTNKIKIRKSEHPTIRDEKQKYIHVRLNRSTDKKWGKQPARGDGRIRRPIFKAQRPEERTVGHSRFGTPTSNRPERKPERSWGRWPRKWPQRWAERWPERVRSDRYSSPSRFTKPSSDRSERWHEGWTKQAGQGKRIPFRWLGRK